MFTRRLEKITMIAALSTIVFTLGCDQSSTSSNLSVSTSEENICKSPSTQIIDFGRKSTSSTSAGLRGAFSDIALNPNTNLPGVVYSDTGSLILRYSFWNGSEFKSEIIAGGLTTNFPKLVYLSTGRPLVFWTNGATSIYMASRSTASITETARWTISAIDNIATMTTRALEVSVNPLNQVGIFYISAASTLGRFIGCSSNCETASNYTGMGVITNFITNTASATANSADIKWCNNGSSVYKPYVVYGGNANSIIARCTATNLSDCNTPANWSTTTITDGTVTTGANQAVTKLSIANTADSPFKVVAKTSANEMRVYEQSAGGCATGALSFSATSRQIVSGASIGNAFGNLSQDSAGRYHLVVNDGQTNIKYFNELTGTITSAWNAVGTVETVGAAGLPAAGATRGGMVIDETNDQLLMTYGRTAAVTPTITFGNLVLAYTHCPSANTGCSSSTLNSPSNAAGMVFGNSPIDMTGQISLTTGQFPKTIATAVTSTGRPATAYVDFSTGVNTSGKIKFSLRNGNLKTDSWTPYEVPGTVSPQSLSLSFDHNDRPWIAFYDASSLRYFITTNLQTNGSGAWFTYQFPIGTVAAPTLPAVNAVSLAMAYSGGIAKPVMIVSNSGSATRIVRAAIFNPATETWSSNILIDTGVAFFSKLASDFDKLGNIVLSYYDTTNNAVKYSYSVNGGTSWSSATNIVTITGGMGLEIKLNPSTNKPAIAYIDRASNLVRYKYCTSTIDSCGNSTNWTTLGSGIIEGAAGISTLTAAATDGLLSSSLAFTASGNPYVVYPTGSLSTTANLMYAFSSSASGGLFSTPAALNSSVNANTTSPVVATPANFATGGWAPSSVMSRYGSLHTVYIGPGNFLYATSCGD